MFCSIIYLKLKVCFKNLIYRRKTSPMKKFKEFICESKDMNSYFDSAKYKYEKALEKLDDLGFSKKHRYFETLKETYDIFESRAKQIIQKSNSKYNLRFDFELSWYASGGSKVKDRASISCYVSFGTNSDLYEMFYDDYIEQKKKYTYGFSKEGFYAEKQQQIFSTLNLPFKVGGGQGAYSSSGSRVFLFLCNGELD